jgi:hypothetical protein
MSAMLSPMALAVPGMVRPGPHSAFACECSPVLVAVRSVEDAGGWREDVRAY